MLLLSQPQRRHSRWHVRAAPPAVLGAGSGPHPQQEGEQPHGSPNNRGSQLEEGVEAAPAAPAIAVWAQRTIKCLGINPFACPGSGILVFANKY